jgi:myo-inositol-1(or 4)-monophosphatase
MRRMRAVSERSASGLLDLARRAALHAHACVARATEPRTLVAHKSSPSDPVCAADRIGEAAIRDIIAMERPDDGMLGEEGTDRRSATGLRWVVDALDGTVNYLYGIPHWAISIACEVAELGEWTPIAGVVHDFARAETFTAIRDGGARLNDKPISVNAAVDLSDALIFTEFSYESQTRAFQAAMLAELLPRVRDIRSTGSSALDLCWTAAGRCDGFYEHDLSRWDWSAASLIVEEAGGTVTRLGSGVVAASPTLHADLRSMLDRERN